MPEPTSHPYRTPKSRQLYRGSSAARDQCLAAIAMYEGLRIHRENVLDRPQEILSMTDYMVNPFTEFNPRRVYAAYLSIVFAMLYCPAFQLVNIARRTM